MITVDSIERSYQYVCRQKGSNLVLLQLSTDYTSFKIIKSFGKVKRKRLGAIGKRLAKQLGVAGYLYSLADHPQYMDRVIAKSMLDAADIQFMKYKQSEGYSSGDLASAHLLRYVDCVANGTAEGSRERRIAESLKQTWIRKQYRKGNITQAVRNGNSWQDSFSYTAKVDDALFRFVIAADFVTPPDEEDSVLEYRRHDNPSPAQNADPTLGFETPAYMLFHYLGYGFAATCEF